MSYKNDLAFSERQLLLLGPGVGRHHTGVVIVHGHDISWRQLGPQRSHEPGIGSQIGFAQSSTVHLTQKPQSAKIAMLATDVLLSIRRIIINVLATKLIIVIDEADQSKPSPEIRPQSPEPVQHVVAQEQIDEELEYTDGRGYSS